MVVTLTSESQSDVTEISYSDAEMLEEEGLIEQCIDCTFEQGELIFHYNPSLSVSSARVAIARILEGRC